MKRGIYYVMICLAALTVFSCNKQLDITPIDQIPDAEFWSNERDLDASVAGGFALLRKALSESPKLDKDDNGYHPRHYMYGDRRGLNFMSVGRDPIRDGLDNELKVNRIRSILGGTRQWDDILFNWQSFYQVIEQANIVIDNAHRVPEDKFITNSREYYVAMARYLRAFTYFYIVRVWGDVPLVTKSKTTDKLGRTDMNKVLDFVEAELKAAEPDLSPQLNSIAPRKGTMYATMAHVLAWRHKDAEAVAYANKLLTETPYALIAPVKNNLVDAAIYRNIFRGNTTEGIFEIEFNASTGEYGRNGSLANMTLFGGLYSNRLQPFWTPSYVKIDPSNGKGTITRITDPKMIYPDSSKDLRYLTMLSNPITATTGYNYVFSKYGFTVDPVKNLFDANIVIFRVADIILLRAECNARLMNYTAARADLDAVRKRAWLDPYTGADNTLYMEIFNERSRELLGEGHYFYDLIRFGFLTNPDKNIVPTRPDMTQAEFDEGAWTWPVSNKAFVDNPNMQQLRYWQRY